MWLFTLQGLFGAVLHAFHAENALCAVFSTAGIVGDIHVHGAHAPAFSALDAFAVVTGDTEQSKIAHGLEKHRDGTQILAERPIIFESEGKRNADNIVKCIPGEE